MNALLPTNLRLLLALPLLMVVAACPHAPAVRPQVSCEYVRVDQRDADDPVSFVTRLKRVIARELLASGPVAAGYPKPCRWETASGRVTHCLPDSSLSLDGTDSFLLDEAGFTLTFRVIDFPSPMVFAAEIFLLPTGSSRALTATDRYTRFQRVQILGGICDDAVHRAIIAAGADPLDK